MFHEVGPLELGQTACMDSRAALVPFDASLFDLIDWSGRSSSWVVWTSPICALGMPKRHTIRPAEVSRPWTSKLDDNAFTRIGGWIVDSKIIQGNTIFISAKMTCRNSTYQYVKCFDIGLVLWMDPFKNIVTTSWLGRPTTTRFHLVFAWAVVLLSGKRVSPISCVSWTLSSTWLCIS